MSSVQDVQWQVGSQLPESNRYKACRWAIFNAFFPKERQPDKNADRLLAWTTSRWRSLLKRLRDDALANPEGGGGGSGWDSVVDNLDYWYLRNCPPVGFGITSTLKFCNQARICPWCWARQYVLAPFRLFEKALFDDKGWQVRFPCKLLYFRCRLADDWQEYDACKDHNLRFVLAIKRLAGYARNPTYRRRESHSPVIPNYGGYVIHRINYSSRQHPVFSRSGVLLLKPDAVCVFKAGLNYKTCELLPTRANLAMVLARASRFPSGWYKASAYEVVTYLTQLRRVRMLSTYGVIRQTNAAGPGGDGGFVY